MKKWMSVLLAAVLLLGLHAYPAFADTAAGTEPVRETDLVFLSLIHI